MAPDLSRAGGLPGAGSDDDDAILLVRPTA